MSGGQTGSRRRLLTGLAFLLPNILGFLAFTLVPLGMSFFIAFTFGSLAVCLRPLALRPRLATGLPFRDRA